MTGVNKKYRIFISASEPSGDSHCAGLITALQESDYDIEFVGVGGPRMAETGCELLEITIGRASMAFNSLAHIWHYYKLIKRITAYLRDNKVDLVIVCDSPAFNFHVAKAATKAGIKTLFYVAPQLWAWGAWRIRKLRRRCSKLCCILPFEQDWFGERGVDVTFVGNPILEKLGSYMTANKKQYADFDPENARFALMPGSRSAEIKLLWEPMQQIALRLKEKYPGATFTTVAVDAEREAILKAAQIRDFHCEYSVCSVIETARQVDFSIVTSGSATLQIAAVGCPMVIMYQYNRILSDFVKPFIIKTKYLSLVNILAGKELAPEFMPYFLSIDPIVESIEQLLQERDKLIRLSGELVELARPLALPASATVAQIVGEMLD